MESPFGATLGLEDGIPLGFTGQPERSSFGPKALEKQPGGIPESAATI
jgi:hypothetical protein